WELTVVRVSPDGSSRVILRSASSFTQTFGGQKHSQPERVQLAYADVFPDGRVTPNKSLGMHMDVASILPPLPTTADEMSKGWSAENPKKLQTTTYTPQPSSGAGELVFTAVSNGVMNKIYAT